MWCPCALKVIVINVAKLCLRLFIWSCVLLQAKGLFNKAKSEAGSFPNPAREFANRVRQFSEHTLHDDVGRNAG